MLKSISEHVSIEYVGMYVKTPTCHFHQSELLQKLKIDDLNDGFRNACLSEMTIKGK